MCLIRLVAGARRRICRVLAAAARHATRGCAFRPTRRRSRRSWRRCDPRQPRSPHTLADPGLDHRWRARRRPQQPRLRTAGTGAAADVPMAHRATSTPRLRSCGRSWPGRSPPQCTQAPRPSSVPGRDLMVLSASGTPALTAGAATKGKCRRLTAIVAGCLEGKDRASARTGLAWRAWYVGG